MPVDIIIDDRALAVAIDVKTGNSKQKMNAEDEEELKKVSNKIGRLYNVCVVVKNTREFYKKYNMSSKMLQYLY